MQVIIGLDIGVDTVLDAKRPKATCKHTASERIVATIRDGGIIYTCTPVYICTCKLYNCMPVYLYNSTPLYLCGVF